MVILGGKVEQKVRQYLQENFLFEFGQDIGDDTNLFTAGVMDSFGYIQLIQYLKQEFGIEFTDEEFLTNILVDFAHIVGCLRAKLAGRGVSGI